MNELLYSSISEGSTTSTDHSVELTDDEHLEIKQSDSIKVSNPSTSNHKETKLRPTRHPVGTLSSRKDNKKTETEVLEFEDSWAVRDAVYDQWLLEKKATIKEKRIKEIKNKSQIEEEKAKAIAKQEQLKADAAKAYDKWKTKKDEDLVKKVKAKQQEKGTCYNFLIKDTGVVLTLSLIFFCFCEVTS